MKRGKHPPQGRSPFHQPGKSKRCPMCEQAMDSNRRIRLVEKRSKELQAEMESLKRQIEAGKPGFEKTKGGIIVPSGGQP